MSHRFFRREEGETVTLVDLLGGREYDGAAFQEVPGAGEPKERARLNFMKDVPRVTGDLDFDRLSLSPQEWKLISKVDGRCTLEEVRLLAGLKDDEAEKLFYQLMDAGLIEVRPRGR